MSKDVAAKAGEAQQYDRSKVVQIVHSVIAKMEGLSGEALNNLSSELQDLVRAIENTRAELAAARTQDLGLKHVPTATDELDAVVDATKSATDSIMSACEAMEKMVAGRGDDIEQKVIGEVTKIYEACTFQDITGQRIRKVVNVLRQVEGKVNHLLETLGHGDGGEHPLAVASEKDTRSEEQKLMNGPQLPGNAISQDEIDKLLAGF
ncbi:MAG: chemotaxis protein [Proteobacteria bacterium]|nr:chemotaxis protein [Pseudomonadota bacterium]